MSTTSPLIRLTPFHPSELPTHPLLTSTDRDDTSKHRPDLLPFTLALLDQASSALHPTGFHLTFKSHSTKPSPPSNNNIEIFTCALTSEDITSKVNWSDPHTTGGVGRFKPREIPSEHWFARRSYHANTSSKISPATASWAEFVFGLRDNHCKNEAEFTPTLYDARHILDWNEELTEAVKGWEVGRRDGHEGPEFKGYDKVTLGVYEMCHEIPFPLQPRCFSVLVATAATAGGKGFVNVTIPVNLSSFEHAFYSTGKNRELGEDAMRKKQVVMGVYAAIEKGELIERKIEGGEKEEQTEWIMATASDAKGNVPMVVQKPSMPGAVAKDVGLFLKWIHEVDDAVVRGEKVQVFENDVNAKEKGEGRRRSRGGSSASLEMLSSARSSIEKAASLAPPTS